LKERYKRFT